MVDNCKHVNRITPSSDHSILNPQKWLCSTCGTTESVWACLSCSNVACGRFIEEHALKHYKETKHPLSLEVNDKYAYCYECGDYVLNDNPAGDLKILRNALSAVALQSFEGLERKGRRILRSQSFSSLDKGYHKRLREQDRNHTILWFRRYYLIARAFSAWKQSTPQLQKKLEEEEKQLKREQELEEKRLQRLQRSPSVSTSGIILSPGKHRKGPFIPGVTGLRNLGNTCYMNSVLQVLSHLGEFRTFFLQTSDQDVSSAATAAAASGSSHSNSGKKAASKQQAAQNALFSRQTTMECIQHVSESGKKRTGLNGGSSKSPSKKVKFSSASQESNVVSLCGELHALLRVMWSGKAALVSPHKMLSAVWQLIPFFKGYTQQDAQEFLCEFLDKLSSELETSDSDKATSSSLASLSALSRQPSTSSTSLQALQQQLSAADVAAHFKNLVGNMFHGELVSEVTCQKCGQKSRTKEPFTDLSLEFPQRYHYRGPGIPICYESCHVEEMLALFTEKERLEGKIYACDHCNRRRRRSCDKPTVYTEVEKQFTIQTLPSVLRLHLKRFMWSGRNHRGKISIHVDFSEELDMRPYSHPSCQPASYMYRLNAIVMHHGRGFGSGHYTAFCWNEEAGSWVHCNDAKMEMTSIEKVMSSQAYILFYTQQQQHPPPQISQNQQTTPSTSSSSVTHPISVPRGLRLFDEKADDDITFNHQNSTIPRFLELKRKLSADHSGRMALKKRKSTLW